MDVRPGGHDGAGGTARRAGRSWEPWRWLALIPAAALCCAGLTVARVLPSNVHPHYTMRATSRQLGVLLAGTTDVIAAARTEGLFNENPLPYRSVLGRRWPARKPELIVIAFRFNDPDRLLEREYTLIGTYRLFLSPENEDEQSVTLDTAHHEEAVNVYRRSVPSAERAAG